MKMLPSDNLKVLTTLVRESTIHVVICVLFELFAELVSNAFKFVLTFVQQWTSCSNRK